TTTSSSTTTTTLPPTATVTADVSVREDNPSTRYGAATVLEVDGDTRKFTFLRVRVGGIGARTVSRAVLRLKVANTVDADSDTGGRVWNISNCAWDELTTTWATRPTIDGAIVATANAPVSIGDTVQFDVTSAITRDGTYCFAVDTLSANMVKYISRE